MSFPYLAKTILKYKSPHPTDLSFLKGETIRVTGPSPDDEDWLVGETLDGSRSGGFPKDFVEETDDVSEETAKAVEPQPEPEIEQSSKESEVAVAEEGKSDTAPAEQPAEPVFAAPIAAAVVNPKPAATPIEAPTPTQPVSAPANDDSSPPKPSSFRDRIAAFNAAKPAGPPPAVKPKPASTGLTWSQRQKLRQEQEAAEAAASGGAAAPASTPPPAAAAAPIAKADEPASEPTPSAGMSASDAQSSISKGGSLKERMAALKGAGAFGAPSEPTPPPPATKPKVWTRPVVTTPPATEGDEPTVDVAEGDDELKAEVDAQAQTDEGEAQEEEDEEAQEKARRAAIAARMAKLGARGPMGMPPPKPAAKKPSVDVAAPSNQETPEQAAPEPEAEAPPAAPQSIKMPAIARRAAPPRRARPAAAAAPSPASEVAPDQPPFEDPPPQVPSEEIPLPKSEEQIAEEKRAEELGRGEHGADGAIAAGIAMAPVVEAGQDDQDRGQPDKSTLLAGAGGEIKDLSPPTQDDAEDEDDEDEVDIMQQAKAGDLDMKVHDEDEHDLPSPVAIVPLQPPALDQPSQSERSPVVTSPTAPSQLLGLPKDEIERKNEIPTLTRRPSVPAGPRALPPSPSKSMTSAPAPPPRAIPPPPAGPPSDDEEEEEDDDDNPPPPPRPSGSLPPPPVGHGAIPPRDEDEDDRELESDGDPEADAPPPPPRVQRAIPPPPQDENLEEEDAAAPVPPPRSLPPPPVGAIVPPRDESDDEAGQDDDEEEAPPPPPRPMPTTTADDADAPAPPPRVRALPPPANEAGIDEGEDEAPPPPVRPLDRKPSLPPVITAASQKPPSAPSSPTSPKIARSPSVTQTPIGQAPTEDDEDTSRRQGIAARMAKLGGIKFGMPPPTFKKSSASSADREEVTSPVEREEARLETPTSPIRETAPSPEVAPAAVDEDDESEEGQAARRAATLARLRAGGSLGFGMFGAPAPTAPSQNEELQSPVAERSVVEPQAAAEEPAFEQEQEEAAPPPPPRPAAPPSPTSVKRPSSIDVNRPLPSVGDNSAAPPSPARKDSMSKRPPVPVVKRQSMDTKRSSSVVPSAQEPAVPEDPEHTENWTMADEPAVMMMDEPEQDDAPPPPPPRPSQPLPTPPAAAPAAPPVAPPASSPISAPAHQRSASVASRTSTTSTPQRQSSVRQPSMDQQPRQSMSQQRATYGDLQAASQQVGNNVYRAARGMFDMGRKAYLGDGSSVGFVSTVFDQAHLQRPAQGWGLVIFEQESGSVLKRSDEPRPGDVVAFHDARFKGKKGLSSYSQHVGSVEEPLVAIASEFEQKKHKLRALQVERGAPEEVSYRFDDLKSGRIVVYRPGL